MISPNLKILLCLMHATEKKCPPPRLLSEVNEQLAELAIKNKAFPFLFHLITCPSCRPKVSPRLRKKISAFYNLAVISPSLTEKTKTDLGKFCRKEKLKVVVIKDFSGYKKIELYQDFGVGLDLDLLIGTKDYPKILIYLKKEGFRLKKELILKRNSRLPYYREEHFVNSAVPLSLDLHTQLAIPHQDEFHFLSPAKIRKITRELIDKSQTDKTGLLYPDNEYFLLSLIVHYLASDVLKGLRNLYDISNFIYHYNHEIDWKRFWKIAREFQIKNFSLFIFLLGQSVFNFPEKKAFGQVSPGIILKFLAKKWPIEDIAYFPRVSVWSHQTQENKKMFQQNFYLKLLLADAVPFWRVLRPREGLFVLRKFFGRQE